MGNRYDTRYDYRIATIDDVSDIMDFIRAEWGENHILANDRKLFIWQYGCQEYGDDSTINVVLMTEKDGQIVGLIGFIPYSNNKACLHISTAITKIRANDVMPMAGIELMRRQVALVGEKVNFASGTNPNTILPIFQKVFKHKVGYMEQYYILNLELDNTIAAPCFDDYIDDFYEYPYILKEISSFGDLSNSYDLNEKNEHMSIKSPEFINKRYFEHPYYTYRKWLINDFDNKTVGVIFGREITIGVSKILRIVDYRGDLVYLEKIGRALHDLLKSEKYEYVDLMVSDLSNYNIQQAGFNKLNPDGKTIIPHYFEPFVKANIKNYYQNNGDVVIFKADGDQDRPNRVPRE
ncbi:hypothetical protein [Pseudobutyrivibrio sp.]|uniref:hypothetical protein n=1 Tax=Pseudobutyrivibrio sp. TaxID=2014367 RepID=UPI0025DE123D|nr:hypothetical protein [Pseudobutyrivibrio sp.]MBR5648290.1 hypothetical protein [Pseudobutyrivibrio sp.]